MTKFIIGVVLLFTGASTVASGEQVKSWQERQASKLTCNLALVSSREDLINECSIGR